MHRIPSSEVDRDMLLAAIRTAAKEQEGKFLSQRKFLIHSKITVCAINRYFASWSEALVAAGCSLRPPNAAVNPAVLLADWAESVRKFGAMSEELGFLIESVQGAFPDCEAKRRGAEGKWQLKRIEFEYESRNFRDHGHPPEGCDMIVCWHHNWPECPENIEVIALKDEIERRAQV